MTVQELIDKLAKFPKDANVFADDSEGEVIFVIVEVSPSEDAPNDEVYLELGFAAVTSGE